MKFELISDNMDTLTGMRLAGIDGVAASTKREVDLAVSRACADSGIAVLIVTEGCYELSRDRLDEPKLSAARPLVNVISDSRRASNGSDSIMRLINEAIGIKF